MAQYQPRVEMCFDKGLTPENPLTWTWTDVSSWVTGSVDYDAGRKDESSSATESSIGFVLRNDDSRFTPGHPTSPYYGKLDLGVPVRLTENSLLNQSRLYMGGWSGSAYAATADHSSLDITGDIDLRADIEPYIWICTQSLITTGESNILFPVKPNNLIIGGKYDNAANQRSYMLVLDDFGRPTLIWSTNGTNRLEVSSTVAVPITYGRLAIRATLDVNNGSGGYTVTFYTSPNIDGAWTQLGSPVVVGGGTTSIFSSTAALSVGRTPGAIDTEFINDSRFTGRIYAFQVRNGIDGTLVANADFRGLRGVNRGFTDSTGKVYGIGTDAFIEDPATLAWGYVDSIEPVWPAGDISALHGGQGGHSLVSLKASGLIGQLNRADEPLKSALTRRTISKNPKYYWPCEDGEFSLLLASAVPGEAPMYSTGPGFYSAKESSKIAGFDGLVSSKPLPIANQERWFGDTPNIVDTGEIRVTAAFYIDSDIGDVEPTAVRLLQFSSTGSAGYWFADVRPSDGALAFRAYPTGSSPSPVFDTGFSSFDRIGKKFLLSLWLVQNGANIDWSMSTWDDNGFIGGTSGTINSQTFGRTYQVSINQQGAMAGGAAFGHVSVFDQDTDAAIWDFAQEALMAHAGEKASDRYLRLCEEEGIRRALYGNNDYGAPMGPQTVDTVTNLLKECADADGGILSENRYVEGLVYRTRFDMYDQPPVVFNALTGDISNPFSPVRDLTTAANDVTAERKNGGSVRVSDPGDITRRGRFPVSISVNVASDNQLDDVAGDLLRKGTQTGMRYPEVSPSPDTNSSILPAYAKLVLGDKVKITNLPKQHPASSVELLVQGYNARLVSDTFSTTLNTVNAEPWNPAQFGESWNDDPDMPVRADAENSELWASISTSDTSIQVITRDAPQWITTALDPNDFPFDINIKGEQIRVNSVANLVTDTFTRTVAAGGWGANDTGQSYTVSGLNTDYSVSSGTGRQLIRDADKTTWRTAVVLSSTVNEPDMRGRVFCPALATGDYYAAGLQLGGAGSCYKFALVFQTGGTVDAFISTEASVLGALWTTNMSVVASSWYNIRARAFNGSLYMKAWKDGDLEPAIWQLVRADVSRSYTGAVGFTSIRGSANTNTNLTVQFDNFQLTSHQVMQVTRSINGFVLSHSAGDEVKLWATPYAAR